MCGADGLLDSRMRLWQNDFMRFKTTLGLACVVTCCGTAVINNAQADDPPSPCEANPEWLPETPLPKYGDPAPAKHPAPDCPFYRLAWQTFLYSTQPQADGSPAFLGYPTIEDVFGPESASRNAFAPRRDKLLSLAPRTKLSPNVPRVAAGVNQAGGLRGLLIDQRGNPVYYAIHMNTAFQGFLRSNDLFTAEGIKKADPSLEFPPGIVELKSAWMVVDATHPPEGYFVTRALVPRLKIDAGNVVVDPKASPREVTVALLAIHVVFTIKDHPEFIWSTFEHIDANGNPDTAPVASDIPSNIHDDPVVSNAGYALYKAGTLYSVANNPRDPSELVNSFDESKQSFTRLGTPLSTSVFRLFPASKIKGTVQDLDGDVVAVNASMSKLFASSGTPGDARRFYQLVGAVWLDQPGRDFGVGKKFANKDGQSSDDDGAMVAGEDRLSSTAIESFTQPDQSISLTGAPNCFSCHDTQRIVSDIDLTTEVMKATRLNVSHLLSKFLAESGGASPPLPATK